MKIQISIMMNNSAFDDAPRELARILYNLGRRIELHPSIDLGDAYALQDINGNKVGRAIVTRGKR